VSESGRTDTFRNLVLGVLLAIMIGWVLSVGRGVILPVVASLIVAYIVLGLADRVGRLPVIGPRIPSPVRHVAAVLVIGAALFALMSLILSNVGQVAELAPE
jgi:predicted PurR-regulated permease PerM